MTEKDFPADTLDEDIDLHDLIGNQRLAVRYLRSDIKATLKVANFFYPRLYPIVLRDISSKGAAILCEKKIRKNTTVCLYLLFGDGKRFAIDARVVHSQAYPVHGLKFCKRNFELAEHLLQTQSDLSFN
ncbi:MAG: PilZ domain-containing protein [Methylomonas sp.]|nr:PilZ domain-containing protein [Methylomonas sp.]PPD22588.1 MAG: hypothetical protein CTY23_01515 [Methylomonas sp.]PPD27898.1 MAG: hypothetical protein CTY22_00395 [Methylomonas sp.]PPD40008.1 MAG: hypothetical protein CTY21_00395 [Methylomonas sp.]PPD51998.1 MAG: hypothetical protein CTY11_10295 [Methylomonas sp.]